MNYKKYLISAFIIFVFGVGLTFFKFNLVSEQAEAARMPSAERKEELIHGKFWAFRTANKVLGWGIAVPQSNNSKNLEIIQRVQRETQVIGIIAFLLLISSIVIGIIGYRKRRKGKTVYVR